MTDQDITRDIAAGPAPEPDPDARPSSAADFKRWREQGQIMRLPTSGLVVRVQRVHVAELAVAGKIPDHLTSQVLAQLHLSKRAADDEPATLEEQVGQIVGLVDAVCCAALLEPRMEPEPSSPDVLAPGDMPYADREHVYLWVCGLVEAALPMRFPG